MGTRDYIRKKANELKESYRKSRAEAREIAKIESSARFEARKREARRVAIGEERAFANRKIKAAKTGKRSGGLAMNNESYFGKGGGMFGGSDLWGAPKAKAKKKKSKKHKGKKKVTVYV